MAWTFSASDCAIVFATFMGPIAAVQLQKFLDRRSETNRRQVEVFRSLMASRANTNSPQYVSALNAVPVEFHRKTKVTDAWRDLLLHLNTAQGDNVQIWNERRIALLIELLKKMAESLHYGFRDAEFKDHIYVPQWQVTLMSDQEVLRRGLVDILSGKTPLKMDVTGFPVDPDMAARAAELQKLLIEWLDGKRTPTMKAD